MPSELLVSRAGDLVCAALREDGVTVELGVERGAEPSRAGRVVLARVSRVVPALQAAFLDVGEARDALLHVEDLLLPGERATPRGEDAEGYGAERAAAAARPPIQDRLRAGRDLLVQIARESEGEKGDRATCWIGLPGRLLVLFPQSTFVGVSRRITDPDERQRLRACLMAAAGGRVGLVARTSARGAGEAALRAEAALLLATWSDVLERASRARAPARLHQPPGLPLRLLRDAPAEGFDRIRFDDANDGRAAREFLGRVDPRLAARVELYPGEGSMLGALGLDRELEQLLRPRVALPSGGHLVIEQTEALVSIDVNTGRAVGGVDIEQTALRTNLEASVEIARQLRLRDLGGIVVVDYVDTHSAEHRTGIIDALAQALRSDPARTRIVGLSELGLLQLTRKRTRTGPGRTLTCICATCAGIGRVRRDDVAIALDSGSGLTPRPDGSAPRTQG